MLLLYYRCTCIIYMSSTPLNLILTTDVLARVPGPGLLLYYATLSYVSGHSRGNQLEE